MLAAAGLAAALALGTVQAGSDAIFSKGAAAGSVPSRIPASVGVAIYRMIADAAPAPYVNDMLARAAFDRGESNRAERYAQRLPASAQRDDLLARIALRLGEKAQAQRYFIAAADIGAIDEEVSRLSSRDPAAAYALETQLEVRLQRTGTHPDAVAEAYWRLGTLSARQDHPTRALAQYRKAIALAPFSVKYLLAAAFQAQKFGLPAEARLDFQRALEVDPAMNPRAPALRDLDRLLQ